MEAITELLVVSEPAVTAKKGDLEACHRSQPSALGPLDRWCLIDAALGASLDRKSGTLASGGGLADRALATVRGAYSVFMARPRYDGQVRLGPME